MDTKKDIQKYIELEIETLKALDINAIDAAINLLEETRLSGGNIYIFGNGGSGSTASHMQGDFNKGVSENLEKKFNFVCLNDNLATVLAVANDIGYDEIFRYQLRNKLKDNDVVIAISGSGNSKNVMYAVDYAKECGAKVIGFTGYTGGKLKEVSDISLHVPVMSMQIAEDVHMIFDHLMMSIFCHRLSGIEHVKGN